ncbi:hypothetical protein EJ06DRAFT_549225 [Trichodelitschia bisporula]|uniref:Polynucleotide 5'-hydroxyl-kinase GRC3 n=1 Tax=Trichodelitschia bisporula TaxID=703511 RepID=A0A6G1HUP2_9PEZI|nr:hypothetical protein EJ06DRAFT_549225 [Trichodelitschia bisporula]
MSAVEMKRKRKAAEVPSRTEQPLSAFAAAKSRRRDDGENIGSAGSPDQSTPAIQNNGMQNGPKKSKTTRQPPPRPQSPPQLSAREVLERARTAMEQSVVSGSVPAGVPQEPVDFWDPSAEYQSDSPMVSETDDPADEAELDEPVVQKNLVLSSWKETPGAILKKGASCERLRLNCTQTLAIVGQYELEVESGIVTLQGALLTVKSGRKRVVAPSICPIPVIKCISSGGAVIHIEIPGRIEESLPTLGRVSPLFAPLWATREDDSLISYKKLANSADDPLERNLFPLEIPAKWQLPINTLVESMVRSESVVQICGPANCGKSTFTRLLSNSYLTVSRTKSGPRTIAILDLDPSKQEFAPPGQISLVLLREPVLCPHFAHPSTSSKALQVVRAHAIGLRGYRESQTHFLDAVKDLINHHSVLSQEAARYSEAIPLVARCPTWYQGFASELNEELTKALNPSVVVCLAQGQTKAAMDIMKSTKDKRVELLPPQPFQTHRPPRPAAEMREMQLISYFHAKPAEVLQWDAVPLTRQRPLVVSWGDQWNLTKHDIAGVFIFGEVPPKHHRMMEKLLNGSLVSIIVVTCDGALSGRRVVCDDIPYFLDDSEGYATPLDPKMSRVIGLALVRGIDNHAKQLHLVTPIPGHVLRDIPPGHIVLGFGALECPGWAYTEDVHYHEWARSHGHGTPSMEEAPWVEVAREEEGAPMMQVWKARRFQ